MTVFLVARVAEDTNAVVVLEDDGLVIELVAEPRHLAGLPASHSPGAAGGLSPSAQEALLMKPARSAADCRVGSILLHRSADGTRPHRRHGR